MELKEGAFRGFVLCLSSSSTFRAGQPHWRRAVSTGQGNSECVHGVSPDNANGHGPMVPSRGEASPCPALGVRAPEIQLFTAPPPCKVNWRRTVEWVGKCKRGRNDDLHEEHVRLSFLVVPLHRGPLLLESDFSEIWFMRNGPIYSLPATTIIQHLQMNDPITANRVAPHVLLKNNSRGGREGHCLQRPLSSDTRVLYSSES